MSREIHPSAVIADSAELGENVRIGPFCVIGDSVKIGDDCELISHVSIVGHTTIGRANRFFPFSSIGHEPQDLKFHGEPSEVVIGDENTFRENVTVNPGTEGGGMLTRVGSNNLLMAYSHVAHDCILGSGIVMANCATLAGHITVEDGAVIGGMSAIHQFLRIGRYAMVGGMAGIVKDVPPFCLTSGGYRPSLAGLNIVGLKRRGFTTDQVRMLKDLYRLLLQGRGRISDRLDEAGQIAGDDAQARHLIEFVRSAERGLTIHRKDSSH